ncbi:MAG: DUF4198 domain-containing protein [Gemmataceae bacterium]|nr:DUF4198 domain-containing protein [Gemmataceae bacterium]
MRRIAIVLWVLLFANAASFAHYNMLLPDRPWANKDEKVTFTYQFGHPFEHELFDAPEPRTVIVILPDGKTQKVEKFSKLALKGADGKKVTGYRFTYEPTMRGDHTVVLQTPPIWMEETKDFIQDTVKVVLHVQAQKNWDADLPAGVLSDSKLKVIPLTRPYGLLSGMIFQARFALPPGKIGQTGKVLATTAGQEVEIERYNPEPVKNPPADEFVTFKTKTDQNSVFTFAFPQAGWWCMTAGCHDQKQRQWTDAGREGPIRERATLWIHVDEKK